MAEGNGGGGGGGNNKKPVEVQPHPVQEQLPGIQYCVNSPPPWGTYALFLSIQYVLQRIVFVFHFLL